MQFDSVSVAALQASLLARSLAGQFSLTTQSTTLSFVQNRVPNSELVRPRGAGPWTMISVSAVYRSPNRVMNIPSVPGAPQARDVAGGIQRSYGPKRLPGTYHVLDPFILSIVCDTEPASILMAKGLLLDYLQSLFNLQDARSNEGHAPVRFP